MSESFTNSLWSQIVYFAGSFSLMCVCVYVLGVGGGYTWSHATQVPKRTFSKFLPIKKSSMFEKKNNFYNEDFILSENSGHLIGWITWLCSKIIFLNEFLHVSYSLFFLLRSHKFLVIFCTHHVINFPIFLANTNIFLTMRYQRCF